ncbi:MAG: hypothetical protein ACRDZ2_01145, partial [Ilumatobacteraceae bacterium]
HYTIGHWENWLLTDCTGATDQLPGGQVHPIALFHVPILGAGTSITELFALFGAAGAGTVSLLGYDWEYFAPLLEDVAYRCEGGIVSVERTNSSETVRESDTVAFQIDLHDDDRLVARITNRWRINRGRR